jgi:hypothetical protein
VVVKINWKIGGNEKIKDIYSEIQELEIFKYLISKTVEKHKKKLQKEYKVQDIFTNLVGI